MRRLSGFHQGIVLSSSICLSLWLGSCRETQNLSDPSDETRRGSQSLAADKAPQLTSGTIPRAPSCPASYKIVGGQKVVGNDLAAASTVKIWVRNQRFCTGTLIGPQHLVTAAHCLRDVSAPSDLRLGFGLEGKVVDKLKVLGHRLHPQFTSLVTDAKGGMRDQAFNDVGVIAFEGTLPSGMQPVALAQPEHLFSGMKLILSGYGAYASNDKQLRPLSSTQLQLASYRADYRELQLEVGTGKGACFGDSGGPSFIEGEGGGCLFLAGAIAGPGRNTDYTCESGGGTLMDLTRYQGWMNCAFEQIGVPSLHLTADSSSEACSSM